MFYRCNARWFGLRYFLFYKFHVCRTEGNYELAVFAITGRILYRMAIHAQRKLDPFIFSQTIDELIKKIFGTVHTGTVLVFSHHTFACVENKQDPYGFYFRFFLRIGYTQEKK